MDLKPKTLYLIDISSLFFRSYYAISLNMKNQGGMPTNALYGTLKMLLQLSRQKKPDYMISCFDTKEPSFRQNLYKEYKANREKMPEDLEAQAPYLKIMMDKLLIPYWEKPGFEADDLIASLTCYAKTKNWETYIVSGDKDFAQLVDSSTCLYDTMKNRVYGPSEVEGKWGLPPSQMRDYLSLTGDASDNIPGVKGVGPKSALQLLKSHQNLEGIYNNIHSLKGSLKEKLLKDKEKAYLSRDLIALKPDITWDKQFFERKHLSVSDFSKAEKQAFKAFLEELDFKSLVRKFFPVKTESPRPLKNSWEEITSSTSLPLFSSSAKPTRSGKSLKPSQEEKTKILQDKSSVPSLKIKLVDPESFKAGLPPYALVSLGFYKDRIYLAHAKSFVWIEDGSGWAEFLDYKWVRYSGHDLKSLWKKLQVKNPVAEWDSMIAGHLLNSQPSVSFRKLCQLFGQGFEEEEWSLPQSLFQEQKLKEKLLLLLRQEEMEELFQNIELPLIAVLYDMEKQGARIDLKELNLQSQSTGEFIKNLEFQIYKLAGEEFNLSSPKQMAKILFEKLHLPKGRKTKTGYSTDSQELNKIKALNPILPLILEQRELFKLKSSYIDSLISLRDEKTGRVYTEFKQATTSTGRLSSVNPNLQNIPIRGERGQLIRKAFVAGEGKQLISADYSQIELRILAHITGDENLKKAFEEDLDIHRQTASEIFNIPAREVSSDLRRKSKAVNFGIAYGQGAHGLAESLSISRAEAKEIIKNYFTKFKKIKDYIETIKEELPKKNYVKTLYGRKRFFNPGDLKSPRWKAAVERAAINAPLQGSASDLVKKAMISLNESLPIPILSQVHDELLFECPKEELEKECQEIQSLMETDDILQVPLKVNLSSGPNWFIARS